MRAIRLGAVLGVVAGGLLCDASATDRFFRDIRVESPSGQYRVEAKSPDNARQKGRTAFQSSFVYTCRDTRAKRDLWTRKQAMGEPQTMGEGSTETYRPIKEASPVEMFVSDAGWTVIRTGWDEVIAVDPDGRDRCRIELLSDAFTEEERAKHVRDTTAGPMWSGYSLWYFLDAEGLRLFVVRPWWGRRVIVNVETGKLIDESVAMASGAAAYERRYVMAELAKGLKSRKELEKSECCEGVWPVMEAAYLAGRLKVAEVAPLLEELQEVSYSGSSTSGGLGFGERFEGEVNPHSYSTFTLRQVVHLSLRRLGKVPRPLPLHEFDVQYENDDKHHPYTRKALPGPRASHAGEVAKGMLAEQVLDLIGAPDFVGYGTWEYDMDATPPFSLTLKWDARHVIDVHRTSPALWMDGLVRDAQVVR